MIDNNDDSGFGVIVEAVDKASVDILSEPLIPEQISNPVMLSIISISSNVLQNIAETDTNEDYYLSTCALKRDIVTQSKGDFDLRTGNSSEIVGRNEKHSTNNFTRNYL